MSIRQNAVLGLRRLWRILVMCAIQVACAVADIHAQGGDALARELKFTHLTTNDGLSQGYVTAILQDHHGFMWFATRGGLNRYDGNSFVVYKHNPNDPGTLSSNFIQDLIEDDHGYLWAATNVGVDKFDPGIERFTRYIHDPRNPNSLGGASVKSIAHDGRGLLWFGTEDGGLEKFDPATEAFTHYRNDSDGHFVGRITHVIADSHPDVWFVGERGLFHLNQRTGQITRPRAMIDGLAAESAYEDEAGNLWLLVTSPIVGLVKYDPHAERIIRYSLGAGAVGVANSSLAADGQNGLWVPSSQGLYYFDRRTGRFTYRFQHEETNPNSLDSNAILSLFQDRAGVLWVGTEHAGLNLLNFQQEQFARYVYRPADSNSVSPGRVKAIYQDAGAVLWLGFFPAALNRFDRKTGQITHYLPNPGDQNALCNGTSIASIYKDAAGYIWLGCGDRGVDRFDRGTGHFRHYRHNSDHPNSLISDHVYVIYGDQRGQMWVGQEGGLSRFDPATDGFTNYRPVPTNPASLANSVWSIYQDHSGTLWLGTWGGALIRFDDKAKTFVGYPPDSHDPHRLNGGGITTIHEDRTGTLWVGAFDGLYRYTRQNETFTRYTEADGLPSNSIRCIQEDGSGRLWLSTQKGVSRFDPKLQSFRNYDVSDGLQSNEFSDGCFQSPNEEIFFGGSNGFNAFFPGRVRDNPYVPPVVITSFKIFNKPVAIGGKSVLKKAIPYIESLTLSYEDNVFSFEFAALSYANSHKNRYRYKLENFDPGWNEVGGRQRLATYTNLDPGRYVFRVQGSNSDGVWNEQGVSLPILITPPWYKTLSFRALCVALFFALLWAAYQSRVRQLQHEFNMRLEGRVEERMRIARELHDTLLQSIQGLMFSFQAARNLLPGRTKEAMDTLDGAIREGDVAIAEGRDAIQGLRGDPALDSRLEYLLTSSGKELVTSCGADRHPPQFRVIVEGAQQPLSPLLQDELYRITRELLRNAFRHAHASRIEAEITYDIQFFRLRIRDNGQGIDPRVLEEGARPGHWGLPGIRERSKRIGAQLKLWSEPRAGTEAELIVPARIAYETASRRNRLSLFRRSKV